ncbi:MAG: hypothetical protein JWN30_2777 [Bacilli bacterium]|nr:hypothetical protein [Bacilli bacterium]
MSGLNLKNIPSPVLLKGDSWTAFRDPTAIFHEGVFRLFYTLVETESNGKVYMYLAMSESHDLVKWTKPQKLTPKDQNLNYSSPGNLIRYNDRWLVCLQTYPRPNGEKHGNADCRIWLMESLDLMHWSEPELLQLKGEHVPMERMGRMIDPFLVEDADEPGKWWCFYKQNGVSSSFSYDLKNWTYFGNENAGENVCILRVQKQYVMFHSPKNGIGIMRSTNLRHWIHDDQLLILGQQEWDWAKGRITAGFVLDCRSVPGIEKFLMFFHGTGPEDEQVIFDTHACIGIAWSDDLLGWHWPNKT